jgi:hypothetical protein
MSFSVEDSLGKKIKLEDIVSSWVALLHGTPPNNIFDRRTSISKNQFFDKYGLCNKGPSPKDLKIRKDLKDTEVEEIFGKPINRNGYRYCHLNNEELIIRVELLWMIVHQRT